MTDVILDFAEPESFVLDLTPLPPLVLEVGVQGPAGPPGDGEGGGGVTQSYVDDADAVNAAAIGIVADDLTTETTARIAVDSAEATARATAVSGAITTAAADATTKANAAQTAAATDATTKVAAEAVIARAAESTNATAITTEATNRATAVTAAIATASSDATTKVAAEATARDTAIGVETTARTAADALLVPKTTTVNGHALSGNVTVSKSDVGLGNVDNTADTAKPVSTAQATADAASVTTAAADATSKVAAEAVIARAAESTNATAIAAETTRATAAEAVNTAAIALRQTIAYRSATLPTGALAATYDRAAASTINSAAVLSTGRLSVVAVALEAGQVVTSISFKSGNTALSGVTHCWFAILDSALVYRRLTADDTSATWGSAAVRTANLTTTYTVPSTGLYYLGIMVAGTVPTLMATNSSNVGAINIPPILSGTSDTGLTTPPVVATSAGALTAVANVPYAWCS